MSRFYRKVIKFLSIFLVVSTVLIVTHYIQGLTSRVSKYKYKTTQSHISLRQHGDYWVMNNYISAKEVWKGNESLTLTTHANYMDLEMLPNLLSRWHAPISLSLYASGDDYDNAIEMLDYLNGCMNLGEIMRRFVSIHLVMHQQHVPASLQRISMWRTMASYKCNTPLAQGNQQSSYWYKQKLDYPVNLLRNVARMNARTYYVLAQDLQLLPTPGFAKKFIKFTWEHGPQRFADIRSPYNTVFCLPTFAHKYEAPLPVNKSQLRTVLAQYNISESVYGNAEAHTEWLTAPNPRDEILIFKRSKRMDMCVAYVSINQLEPLYDERCKRESIYQQGANLKGQLLQSLNYTFIILDGAFLVRRTSDSWTKLNSVEPATTSAAQIRDLWETWNHFYKRLLRPVPEKYVSNWYIRTHYNYLRNNHPSDVMRTRDIIDEKQTIVFN